MYEDSTDNSESIHQDADGALYLYEGDPNQSFGEVLSEWRRYADFEDLSQSGRVDPGILDIVQIRTLRHGSAWEIVEGMSNRSGKVKNPNRQRRTVGP